MMLPSINKLARMMNINITEVDRDQLVDIRTIEIDTNKPVKDRVCEYIEAVHNPFLVKVGDYVVKISYQDSGADVNERMLSYAAQMTKIDC